MRKLLFLLLAFVTMIGLSACGGQTSKTVYAPQSEVSQKVEEYRIDEKMHVGIKELPDGRKVTCVGYNGNSLSCDWNTAQR